MKDRAPCWHWQQIKHGWKRKIQILFRFISMLPLQSVRYQHQKQNIFQDNNSCLDLQPCHLQKQEVRWVCRNEFGTRPICIFLVSIWVDLQNSLSDLNLQLFTYLRWIFFCWTRASTTNFFCSIAVRSTSFNNGIEETSVKDFLHITFLWNSAQIYCIDFGPHYHSLHSYFVKHVLKWFSNTFAMQIENFWTFFNF